MSDRTFSDLLISRTKLEVLRFLMNNQSEQFTINEVSENVEASYTTVNKFVKDLEDFGIVNISDKGSAKLVQLNHHSPYIAVLEELGSLDARPLKQMAEDYAEKLRDSPKSLGGPDPENISCIVLFGSVARGMPKKDSDLDILILVTADPEGIEALAHDKADELSRDSGKEISPLVMKEKEFSRNLRSGDPLANNIREEGEVLQGKKRWRKLTG